MKFVLVGGTNLTFFYKGDTMKVFGVGKWYNKRQVYTDENGDTFVGIFTEARRYFQQKYPSQSIIISTQPKKRR